MFNMISVVIPALNEEKYIGQCLQALLEVDRAGMAMEIIVVDNGSRDRTVDIAQQYATVTLIKKGVTIAALRNHGVKVAKGDLLAFVDADCVVAKDWLDMAVRCLVNESADATGSHHVVPRINSWIFKALSAKKMNVASSRITYIPSGNFLIKRACFEEIGGFNELLVTNEDVDICSRLKKSNYKLFSDPSIKSTHFGYPHNTRDLFRRELWHGQDACTLFFNDLKKITNTKIVLYSFLNLLLIMCLIGGVVLLFLQNNYSAFIISVCSILLLNLLVTLRDWKKIRKYFMSSFTYNLIYGAARSFSAAKWFFKTIRPQYPSNSTYQTRCSKEVKKGKEQKEEDCVY